MPRYIQLFERFRARNISKTIGYIKNNTKGEGNYDKFLSSVRLLYSELGIEIGEIKDEYFEYARKEKAIKRTKPSDYDISYVKYWFSIEDGFLGTTYTKPMKIGKFLGGEWVKYEKDGNTIIVNVDENQDDVEDGYCRVVKDGNRFAISEDKLSELSKEDHKNAKSEVLSYIKSSMDKLKSIYKSKLAKSKKEDIDIPFKFIHFDIKNTVTSSESIEYISKLIDDRFVRAWFKDGSSWMPALLKVEDGKLFLYQNKRNDSDFVSRFENLLKTWWLCTTTGNDAEFDTSFGELVLMLRESDIYENLEFEESDINRLISSIKRGSSSSLNEDIQNEVELLYNENEIKFPEFNPQGFVILDEKEDILYDVSNLDLDKKRDILELLNYKRVSLLYDDIELSGIAYRHGSNFILAHNEREANDGYRLNQNLPQYKYNVRISYQNITKISLLTDIPSPEYIYSPKFERTDDSDFYSELNSLKLKTPSGYKYTTISFEQVNNSDFAIMLDIDSLYKANQFGRAKGKRKEREESRRGATSLMSDEDIKNQNLSKYSDIILGKMGLSNEVNFNFNKINPLITKIFQGNYILFDLFSSNYSLEELMSFKSDLFKVISSIEKDWVYDRSLRGLKIFITDKYKKPNYSIKNTIDRFKSDKNIDGLDEKLQTFLMVLQRFIKLSEDFKNEILNREINNLFDLELLINDIKSVREFKSFSLYRSNNIFDRIISSLGQSNLSSSNYIYNDIKFMSNEEVNNMVKVQNELEKFMKSRVFTR